MNIEFGKDGSGVTLQTKRGSVKRKNVDQYQNVYCWEYDEDSGSVYVELRDNFYLKVAYVYIGEKWRFYEDTNDDLVLEFYDGTSWNTVTYFQGA